MAPSVAKLEGVGNAADQTSSTEEEDDVAKLEAVGNAADVRNMIKGSLRTMGRRCASRV